MILSTSRRAVLAGLLLVSFSGCDVFLDDWGDVGQVCRSKGDCQEGLICSQVGRCVPEESYCEDDDYCGWINPEAYCDTDLNECHVAFGAKCGEKETDCGVDELGEFTDCKFFAGIGEQGMGRCTKGCDDPTTCDNVPDALCTITPENYAACAQPGWADDQNNLCTMGGSDCTDWTECVTFTFPRDEGDRDLCLETCTTSDDCPGDLDCMSQGDPNNMHCSFATWHGLWQDCQGNADCEFNEFAVCHPDNYCTKTCGDDADCPKVSYCVDNLCN